MEENKVDKLPYLFKKRKRILQKFGESIQKEDARHSQMVNSLKAKKDQELSAIDPEIDSITNFLISIKKAGNRIIPDKKE